MQKCNIMDAADKQALNTHHQPVIQVELKILGSINVFTYLDNPLLDPSVTPFLLLLLRAGCLTRLPLWADGLFDGFLGRPKERVRGNFSLLLVLYQSAVTGSFSSPCTETRLDLYQVIVGSASPSKGLRTHPPVVSPSLTHYQQAQQPEHLEESGNFQEWSFSSSCLCAVSLELEW